MAASSRDPGPQAEFTIGVLKERYENAYIKDRGRYQAEFDILFKELFCARGTIRGRSHDISQFFSLLHQLRVALTEFDPVDATEQFVPVDFLNALFETSPHPEFDEVLYKTVLYQEVSLAQSRGLRQDVASSLSNLMGSVILFAYMSRSVHYVFTAKHLQAFMIAEPRGFLLKVKTQFSSRFTIPL